MGKPMHWYTAPNAQSVKPSDPLLCVGPRPGHEAAGDVYIPFKNGVSGPSVRFRDDEVIAMEAKPCGTTKVPFPALLVVTAVDPAVITRAGAYIDANGTRIEIKSRSGAFWLSGPVNGAFYFYNDRGVCVDPTNGVAIARAAKIVRRA